VTPTEAEREDILRVLEENNRVVAGNDRTSVADEYERRQRDEIIQALAVCKGRVGGADGAAARLGVNRTTLLFRRKKYGIYAKQCLSASRVVIQPSPVASGRVGGELGERIRLHGIALCSNSLVGTDPHFVIWITSG
jgi:hypothetical protein